ncbi:dTMP kinase [Actinomadura rudentiformis]|uniref:Thymidylate kinase n=1 Tax=Actinomadura rudentiformis TaxID=359158 RepID=A0A6H9Z9S6_9ACTN|nr:dTMP kinase [Actinomadura rudentiformis]KAB2350854.1 dTMP kinase [Actinomadura rudentiformis]
MTRTGAVQPPVAAAQGLSSIKPFRRLLIAVSLSSLGHWLSVLALTAMAGALTRDKDVQGQAQIIATVLLAMVVPAVIFAPLAGALAIRLDRRTTMIAADVVRFALLVSVPLIDSVAWTLAAALLVACVTLLWIPMVSGSGPELVPEDRHDDARRAGRMAAYGTAPVAAGLFSVLALIAGSVWGAADRADLALYLTAVVFLASAAAVSALSGMPAGGGVSVPSPLRLAFQGLRSAPAEGEAGPAPLRGLALGVVGVALSCGAVISVAKVYARELGGGDAGYGAIATALSLGLAFGIFLAPRILGPFSRRRLLGLAVVAVALDLLLISLVQNLVVVVFTAGFLGVAAGVAYAAGTILAGDDQERAFGYLSSVALISVLAAVAVVPPVAGVVGDHRIKLLGDGVYDLTGAGAALFIVAVLVLLSGLIAYRRLDDRRGIPLLPDLAAALRGETYTLPAPETQTVATPAVRDRGIFIAFEGGEGAGKTTQARLVSIWLRDHGFEVVSTREPGATKTGMRLRALLLDKETTGLSDRAETLLYAADRADHVANVIRPAMERGAIVVSDRYIDSSLAYQGFGRQQRVDDIARLNAWATAGLIPDLTVLLELPPEAGLGRLTSPADRIESESQAFHERVLGGFRALAEADPERYLVIDASRSQAEISRLIQDRIRAILPDPIPAGTEDITSTFPAITDA